MGEETKLADLLTEQVDRSSADFDQLSSRKAIDRLLAHQADAITAVSRSASRLTEAADAVAERLRQGEGRLVYGGAGTSIRLGVQDGVELTPTFGWPFSRLAFCIAGDREALLQAQEGAEDDQAAGRAAISALAATADDIVIAITASGRTPYTLGVADAARAAGAMTLGIANVPN
ncbi:MAG: N-acetylmuramic acid 6-phosphate etherase, partial [Pseudomonadales bacterium]